MLEEKFKMVIASTIAEYNQKGMTIGTQFYILKDILNEVATVYNQSIQEEMNKEKTENNSEEKTEAE